VTEGGPVIDTVALLLADRSLALRYRALVEVDGAPPDDPEVRSLRAELATSPEATRALDAGAAAADPRSISFSLSRLAHVGVGREHPAVVDLADRLFEQQRRDGSWPPGGIYASDDRPIPRRGKASRPADEGYRWRTLQTALPLRGLAAAGFATDPRAERAFEWILERRLDDGSFSYGLVSGRDVPSGVVGYRRLPRSEGCRASTTGVLACFAHHPDRRTSEEARGALDLLLQRETREEATIGFEVARLLGVEQARGFATFYARFDLAFLLELATRIGVSAEDERISDLVTFLQSKRSALGLWDHPAHPHLSRWLTLELLSSLRRLETGDWAGTDLRVDFRAYPRRRRRY
jgi:hypothetical protein